jgi:sigma-B regulation protein RsbU (phosphoserine phosphatase)
VTAAESEEHSDRVRSAFLDALVHDDPVALYDSAPCGFLTTTPDGLIVKTNATFRTLVQRDASELVGEASFPDLLTVGSKLYYETHLGPSLLMSDRVQEIALDMVRADGTRLPVLVNASLARGDDGSPRAVRIAVFDATERRSYERELLDAKQRAEASEKEARELARTLQQTLIPPTPPVIPGLRLATAYHPAGHGTEVGGDFFDVFRVGPDDWVITLGDVCGKGYEAAVVTTLVRHTLRALCVGEDPPREVLAALDRILHEHPTDRFCTAALCRLRCEGDSWHVTLALGGHPQPLLLRPGQAPEPCGEFGPLLGVVDLPVFEDTTLRLDPGDALLLYTDGVLEGRHGNDFYGERRLVATAGRIGPDPDALVDSLVREVLDFQDGTLRDDVAVVAFGPPA